MEDTCLTSWTGFLVASLMVSVLLQIVIAVVLTSFNVRDFRRSDYSRML
jgi:hypothetical protein